MVNHTTMQTTLIRKLSSCSLRFSLHFNNLVERMSSCAFKVSVWMSEIPKWNRPNDRMPVFNFSIIQKQFFSTISNQIPNWLKLIHSQFRISTAFIIFSFNAIATHFTSVPTEKLKTIRNKMENSNTSSIINAVHANKWNRTFLVCPTFWFISCYLKKNHAEKLWDCVFLLDLSSVWTVARMLGVLHRRWNNNRGSITAVGIVSGQNASES